MPAIYSAYRMSNVPASAMASVAGPLVGAIVPQRLTRAPLPAIEDPYLLSIIGAVAARFDVPDADLRSPSRYCEHLKARQALHYIAVRAGTSLTEAGRVTGHDHTTVRNSVRAVTARRAADPELDASIRAIEAAL